MRHGAKTGLVVMAVVLTVGCPGAQQIDTRPLTGPSDDALKQQEAARRRAEAKKAADARKAAEAKKAADAKKAAEAKGRDGRERRTKTPGMSEGERLRLKRVCEKLLAVSNAGRAPPDAIRERYETAGCVKLTGAWTTPIPKRLPGVWVTGPSAEKPELWTWTFHENGQVVWKGPEVTHFGYWTLGGNTFHMDIFFNDRPGVVEGKLSFKREAVRIELKNKVLFLKPSDQPEDPWNPPAHWTKTRGRYFSAELPDDWVIRQPPKGTVGPSFYAYDRYRNASILLTTHRLPASVSQRQMAGTLEEVARGRAGGRVLRGTDSPLPGMPGATLTADDVPDGRLYWRNHYNRYWTVVGQPPLFSVVELTVPAATVEPFSKWLGVIATGVTRQSSLGPAPLDPAKAVLGTWTAVGSDHHDAPAAETITFDTDGHFVHRRESGSRHGEYLLEGEDISLLWWGPEGVANEMLMFDDEPEGMILWRGREHTHFEKVKKALAYDPTHGWRDVKHGIFSARVPPGWSDEYSAGFLGSGMALKSKTLETSIVVSEFLGLPPLSAGSLDATLKQRATDVATANDKVYLDERADSVLFPGPVWTVVEKDEPPGGTVHLFAGWETPLEPIDGQPASMYHIVHATAPDAVYHFDALQRIVAAMKAGGKPVSKWIAPAKGKSRRPAVPPKRSGRRKK